MKVTQHLYTKGKWTPLLPEHSTAQLVLGFGCRLLIEQADFELQLQKAFPYAESIGCSTSGGIYGDDVYDDALVLTVFEFSSTSIRVVSDDLKDRDSVFLGHALASQLPLPGLRYVFALCDGQLINGSQLVAGITSALADDVSISGGLAGDDERFERTISWHNNNAGAGKAVLCGFYGDNFQVGLGSLGGWESFGPEREITRSTANILYELDGQPALELYKRYLGDRSKQLPASALRFPLSLKLSGEQSTVTRTILAINEDDQSMIFAGDVPKGATARLMKGTHDAIIDGAGNAAKSASLPLKDSHPDFALLVSCVDRRMLLGQRVFEEIEAVCDVIGPDCLSAGFYSYGEISPLMDSGHCQLHNQTMTITLFKESD